MSRRGFAALLLLQATDFNVLCLFWERKSDSALSLANGGSVMLFAECRLKAQMTIQDVAEEFSVSMERVRDWESGKSTPPVQVIRSLDLIGSFTARSLDGESRSTAGAVVGNCYKTVDISEPLVDGGQWRRHQSKAMDIHGIAPNIDTFDADDVTAASKRCVRQSSTTGSRKPRLLDLFCCAGGAAVGYHRAGFDVVGVDIVNRPSYPYTFIQADAMKLEAEFIASFDAIHASPPCQSYSDLAKRNGNGDDWPRLIEPVRDMLKRSGRPYVIENVEGAPLVDAVVLCGTMFPGLRVLRHRLFEANFKIVPPPHRKHPKVHTFDKRKSHYGKTNEWTDFVQVTGGGNCSVAAARDAMGIDWMTKGEINEAIPPAYTELIGRQLLAQFEAAETRRHSSLRVA
jgi:DNA (cytosine-5)-methyltransferase 1